MSKFAANLTMLFTELPFLERFAAAREAGFAAVEFLFPYEWPAAELGCQLQLHGLTQALFNMPPGNWGRGSAAWPPSRDGRPNFAPICQACATTPGHWGAARYTP
ncbi:hypothetical protein [Aeromonas caviae]|uniref:hypothetical protein n=1 Tax=Aeromonas caviae TaxID=648 RepID=UPI003F7AF4A0